MNFLVRTSTVYHLCKYVLYTCSCRDGNLLRGGLEGCIFKLTLYNSPSVGHPTLMTDFYFTVKKKQMLTSFWLLHYNILAPSSHAGYSCETNSLWNLMSIIQMGLVNLSLQILSHVSLALHQAPPTDISVGLGTGVGCVWFYV